MTETQASALANELMTKHGLSDWHFAFDGAKRRLGYCLYGKKAILLSKAFLPLLRDSEIKDTLLHEIAHALVGKRHGHDKVWKAKAIEIGCNGQRLYRGPARVKAKYKGTCPKCGKVIERHSRKKISCGSCSPIFKKELMFKWELNTTKYDT